MSGKCPIHNKAYEAIWPGPAKVTADGTPNLINVQQPDFKLIILYGL